MSTSHLRQHSMDGVYRTGSFGRHSRASAATEPIPPQSSFDEGVEVVLDHGASKIVEESPPRGGCDAYNNRAPVQRPRPVRAPHRGYGGPPPPQHGRGGGYPNQVPHDPSNGSFDAGGEPYYRGQPPPPHSGGQYSPQVSYPGYPSEDVNVISPNHPRGNNGPDPRYSNSSSGSRPPSSSSRQYYRYPPASPVSRPNHSPPRSKQHHHHHRGPPPPPSQVSSSRRAEPFDAYHPDDGTFNAFDRQPPLVREEGSFDSEHQYYQQQGQYPPEQFYGGANEGGSWHSFDNGPPPFEDSRYPPQYPPDSPYYQDGGGAPPYGSHLETPYPVYSEDPFYPEQPPPHYDHHHHAHHAAMDQPIVSPDDKKGSRGSSNALLSTTSKSGIMLPKAAGEVDFEVTQPPPEPVTLPSTKPVVATLSQVNQDDVLCGRGGGTNSQIGNRRFRQLVQEFQPTYLMARRKEKPLLARTIVLIIRKRGGRFLKKNEETGELYEVGDSKAEAKTSQALREGLDVRATKSADKKKKGKKGKGKEDEEHQDPGLVHSPSTPKQSSSSSLQQLDDGPAPSSPPPPMPRLQGPSMAKSGIVHPHSPEALNFRKRRRMRSKEGVASNSGGGGGCGVFQDRLFMDFCPPRADLARPASPHDEYDPMDVNTPPRSNSNSNLYEDDMYADSHQAPPPAAGCTDIAMMAMMGAATGSFCLGPKWRS